MNQYITSRESREKGALPGHEKGAPLGIYGKSDSRPENTGLQVNQVTGEILSDFPENPKQRRAKIYQLKSVVNMLLPKSSTSSCTRCRIKNQDVQVHKSIEHNKAFFLACSIAGQSGPVRSALPKYPSAAAPN